MSELFTDPQRDVDPQHDVDPRPLARVRARRSSDELLHGLQQSLDTHSGQSDLKANIVITTSSIVLTVAATRWNDNNLRPAILALGVGVFAALICAILSVFPKFRTARSPQRLDLGPDANPLFFGHFAMLPRERFVDIMAEILEDDALVYEAVVNDIYAQGCYLYTHKYRYLRASYLFLMGAFAAAVIAMIVSSAF